MSVQFKLLEERAPGTTIHDQATEQPSLPATLSDKVTRALAQRVEREAMSMLPSLAREAAKNSLQATLDIHRANQTVRVAMEVGDTVRESLGELEEKTLRAAAKHPELEADFEQMQEDTSRVLKQLNQVAAIGYLRRYHQVV